MRGLCGSARHRRSNDFARLRRREQRNTGIQRRACAHIHELQFTLGEGALDLVCAQPGPLSGVREWHFEHNPVTVGLTGGLQTRYGRDRLHIAAVTFPGGCGVNRDKRYRRGARTRESLNAVDVRGFCQLNSRQASSLNRYGSSIQPGSIVRRRIRLGRSRKRCIAMVGL
jgi:hypothetical protein